MSEYRVRLAAPKDQICDRITVYENDRTSLFIKNIFKNNFKKILITKPVGVVPKIDLNIIKKFIEIPTNADGIVDEPKNSENYQFFKKHNFQLYQEKEFFEKNFGTFPVIYMKFPFTYATYTNIIAVMYNFRLAFNVLFRGYSYLLKSPKLDAEDIGQFKQYYNGFRCNYLFQNEIIDALAVLSKFLCKHFDNKKVFLLIDRYEDAISKAIFEENNHFYHIFNLYKKILSNTLNSEYVDRAVLTGADYFYSLLLSDVSNLKMFKFLDENPFLQHDGLTEVELDSFFVDDNENKIKEEFKSLCNGYVNLKGMKLFSLPSLINYLYGGVCNTILRPIPEFVLKVPIIRYSIEKLYLNQPLKFELIQQIENKHGVELKKILSTNSNSEPIQLEKPDVFLNYILHQGYLTCEKVIDGNFCQVKLVDNSTIESVINQYFYNNYSKNYHDYLKHCSASFDQIFSKSEEDFERFVTQFYDILYKLSFESPDSYHDFIFSIFCKTNFVIGDQLTFTEGKPDLIFYKKNFGIVIQITYGKCSKIALIQAIEKYEVIFNEKSCFKDVNEIMYLGLNVNSFNKVNLSVLVNCTDITNAKH